MKKFSISTIGRILVLLIFVIIPAVSFAGESIATLSADEFFSSMEQARAEDNAVVLDIRTPGEFSRGHAPGALNIDYYDRDFADMLSELDRDRSYYIYCQSGNRSGRSLAQFRRLGFKSVHDLAGGWSANAGRLSAIEE